MVRKIERPITPVAGTTLRQIGVRLWGEGAYEREPIDGGATKYPTLFEARENDVVVNKIWARNGSVAVVQKALDGAVGSGEFPMFAPDLSRLDPRWMHWLTKTSDFWKCCDEKSQGTSGKNRIRPEQFLSIEIPLPTLAEQNRLVTRIDTVSRLTTRARLLRNESLIAADALLSSATSRLFEASPHRLSLESVSEVRGGIQKSPVRQSGGSGVRYLTVAHVQRNRILTDDPRFFEVSAEELDRLRLIAGDVLIIEGNGSVNEIGRTALFRGEIENCVHQNHVIRIRPQRDALVPEFLNAYLNSPAGRAAVASQARSTSGLRTLSVGRIRAIEVPDLDIAEQHRIVRELLALQAEIDTLKAAQAASQSQIDALLPAILDRAFAGAL